MAPWWWQGSAGEHAAFDGQGDAGDVAARVTGEEDQCGTEFFGPAEPSGQGAGQDGGIEVAAVELLATVDQRPDPLTAFRIARGWFQTGRRIEMRELATELGVNRATLFRWVGNRDELLAEILWSLAEPTLAAAVDDAPGHGGQRIATAIGRFATLIDQAAFFRDFLRREPERALRILTTRAGTVQSRW
jgi:Tetracyclin repressor-like, C-terminal domain